MKRMQVLLWYSSMALAITLRSYWAVAQHNNKKYKENQKYKGLFRYYSLRLFDVPVKRRESQQISFSTLSFSFPFCPSISFYSGHQLTRLLLQHLTVGAAPLHAADSFGRQHQQPSSFIRDSPMACIIYTIRIRTKRSGNDVRNSSGRPA